MSLSQLGHVSAHVPRPRPARPPPASALCHQVWGRPLQLATVTGWVAAAFSPGQGDLEGRGQGPGWGSMRAKSPATSMRSSSEGQERA